MAYASIQEASEYYRAWLAHRDYSPATIEKYTRVLARFLREVGSVALDPVQAARSAVLPRPTAESVISWRDSLVERGYQPASVNAMLAAVNGYQDCIGNGQAKVRPLKRQRRIFSDPSREISRNEYFRLLRAAQRAGDARTLLILETLCSTGIRVSELPFITVEAARCGRVRIQCKGKCREILLPKALRQKLVRWAARRRIPEGPVFRGRTGKPLSRVTVWRLLKGLCQGARVSRSKVFPHNLRHLFARTFYELDKNLSKLADVLGHSSIETTRIYIMESGAEHERLLNRMHLML